MTTDCNTAANDVVDTDWTVDVFNVLKGVDHSCNKRLMSTIRDVLTLMNGDQLKLLYLNCSLMQSFFTVCPRCDLDDLVLL